MPRSNQKRTKQRRNRGRIKGKQQDKTRTVIGREREMGEKTIPDETIKKVHEFYKALNELGEQEHETTRISEHAMGKQRMGIERANSTFV